MDASGSSPLFDNGPLLGQDPALENSQGIVLYKFPAVVNEAVARAWTMASRDARYCFYDDAQHLATATEWRLKLDRGGVDVDVHSDVEMDFDTDMCFATFYHAHHSEVCRLAFPTEAACQKFSSLWSNKIFENQQSGGEDTFRDPEPVTQPAHWSTTPAAPRTGQRIVGVTPGAGRYSFLLQQGTVSVLKNQHGGVSSAGTSFALSAPLPTTSNAHVGDAGASFTPMRGMLASNETKMNVLTTEKRNSVLQADLDTGRVVREWKCTKDAHGAGGRPPAPNGDDVAMKDIAPDTKAAQLDDGCSTFLGLGDNCIMRWDQRTPQGVVQDLVCEKGKHYSSNPNFTCMATSGEGFVAVGSLDGRVRLYGSRTPMDKFDFTKASTDVPGLKTGRPITAIDVSHDALWVLATTDKYLIVVPTAFRDTNGFVSPGARHMPPHKLLRISAEDHVRAGENAKLSNAKLTWITDPATTERSIVASFGTFSVVWNFRQVKAATPSADSDGTVCGHYRMVPAASNERVVANAFLHDKYAQQAKNALVIATEHELYNADEEDESSDFE